MVIANLLSCARRGGGLPRGITGRGGMRNRGPVQSRLAVLVPPWPATLQASRTGPSTVGTRQRTLLLPHLEDPHSPAVPPAQTPPPSLTPPTDPDPIGASRHSLGRSMLCRHPATPCPLPAHPGGGAGPCPPRLPLLQTAPPSLRRAPGPYLLPSQCFPGPSPSPAPRGGLRGATVSPWTQGGLLVGGYPRSLQLLGVF